MKSLPKKKEHQRANVGEWIVVVYMAGVGHFDAEVIDEDGAVHHRCFDYENAAAAETKATVWADNHRKVGRLVAGIEWSDKTGDWTGVIYGPGDSDVERFSGYRERDATLREMVDLAEARERDASAPGPAPVTAGLLTPAEEGALAEQAEAVAHDPEEAMALADTLVVLGDGRLLAVGPPRALYERPPSLAVGRLLGELTPPAEPTPEDVVAAAKEAEQILRESGAFTREEAAIAPPRNADEVWTLMAVEEEMRQAMLAAGRALERAKAHLKAAEKDYEHAVSERVAAYNAVSQQQALPLAPAPSSTKATQLPASPIRWAFNGLDFVIEWVRGGDGRFIVSCAEMGAGDHRVEVSGSELEATIEQAKAAVSDLYADVDPGEKPDPKKRGRGKGKAVAPSEPAGAPKTAPKRGGPGRGGRRSKQGLSAEVTEG